MSNTKHLRAFVAVLHKIQSDIKPEDDVLRKIRDQAANTQDGSVSSLLGLYYSDVEWLIGTYENYKVDILKEHYKVMCNFIDCAEKVPNFQLGLEAFATFKLVLLAYAVSNKVKDLTPKESGYYYALFELFVNELDIETEIREFLNKLYSQVPTAREIDLAEQTPENNDRETEAFFIVFNYMLTLLLRENNQQFCNIVISPLSNKVPTFLWKFMIEYYIDKNTDSTRLETKEVGRILLSNLFMLFKVFPFLFYMDESQTNYFDIDIRQTDYWALPSYLVERIIEPSFLKSEQGSQFAEVTKDLAELPLSVQAYVFRDVPSISSVKRFFTFEDNNDGVTNGVEVVQDKLELVLRNAVRVLPRKFTAKIVRVDQTSPEEEREIALAQFRIQMF
jgi:hypothetical protein